MSRAVVLALFALGCGGSHDPDPRDGAVADAPVDRELPDVPDVGPVDASEDAAEDAEPPRCGDRRVDPGEQCDDGLDPEVLGCDDACERAARCGDRVVDDDRGEVCDDGDFQAGDRCSVDCRSTETCGDGVVDRAAREVCDDDSGACAANCRSIAGCGDGVASEGEICDDGDLEPFDGCGPDCKREIVFALEGFDVAPEATGCDLDGDATIDNGFGHALGDFRPPLNTVVRRDFTMGVTNIVVTLQSLDDFVDDDEVLASVMVADDVDGDASNNFGGEGHFRATEMALSADHLPRSRFVGSLSSSLMSGGPVTLGVAISSLSFDLVHAELRARLQATTPRRLVDGLACGVLPAPIIDMTPNPAEFFAGIPAEPCVAGEETSLLDFFVGGMRVVGFNVPPAPIDLDLDGDGLEVLEVVAGDACIPVIIACVDGDGTRIEGTDCVRDPRIVDGYSFAATFSAVEAVLEP